MEEQRRFGVLASSLPINMMQAARRVRSKSPFGGRRSRSKSPFRTRRRRSKSPFHRKLITVDAANSNDVNDLVHESEINIFQQLCLDKHDDNAAIEILLEEPLTLFKHQDIPDLCPTSSCSTTDVSPNTLPSPQQTPGPFERKGTFLKRLFKSPSKSPVLESEPLENVPSRGSIASASSDGDDAYFIPKPPSRIPSVRDKSDLKIPYTMSKRIASQRSETLSRMSSLSGTGDSSFTRPHALNRHESLGNDSIKDVRKALKEMEKQLGNASSHGKRISRQKVMRALFTVADSLDDLEERQRLQKELSGLMKMDREERRQQDLPSPSDGSSSNDDDSSEISSCSDDEEGSEEEDPIVGAQAEANLSKDEKDSSFNLFSSVGKFFSISPDEKKGVERALDDLLWTEFVITRHTNTPTKEEPSFREDGFPRGTSSNQTNPYPNFSSTTRLAVSPTVPNPEKSQKHRHIESSSRHDSWNMLGTVQMTNLAPDTTDFERRGRHQESEFPSPIQLQEQSPCRRGRSWWRRRPSQVLIKNDALGEYGHSPCTDFENHGYLPPNIELNNDKKYRNIERSQSVPQANMYQMKMVDTSSRCGYEMTTASFDRKSSKRR